MSKEVLFRLIVKSTATLEIIYHAEHRGEATFKHMYDAVLTEVPAVSWKNTLTDRGPRGRSVRVWPPPDSLASGCFGSARGAPQVIQIPQSARHSLTSDALTL